jgi:hypothetical protein
MMNRKMLLISMLSSTVVTLLVLGVVWLFLPSIGSVFARPEAGAPTRVNYQGYLTDSAGAPLTGKHDLTLGIYAAESGGSPLWEDTFSDVAVTGGYFSVVLGSNAAKPLAASVFNSAETWLQVTIDGSTSLPRQPIDAVPYALQAQQAAAAPWSGLTGAPSGFADNLDGVEYQGVVVVAKSGGDFTTITAALDSILDASDTNRYLIWVAPGVYEEHVVMEPYVDIAGASINTTIIRYTATDAQGAVVAASNAMLQSITVENPGSGTVPSVGIYCGGVTQFTIFNVKAKGMGGNMNYGVYVIGGSDKVYISDSELIAEGTPTNTIALLSNESTTWVVETRLEALYRPAYRENGGKLWVAMSQFIGGAASGARCASVYDENFLLPTPGPNGCP